MRIRLGHGPAIFYIVSHDDIVQSKISSRPVWQMANLERICLELFSDKNFSILLAEQKKLFLSPG
jgi:hypothetical protein